MKFYLNKFAKCDNIENYTLKTIRILQQHYEDFKNESDGVDPDYPSFNFGAKGKKVKGTNAAKNDEDIENGEMSE